MIVKEVDRSMRTMRTMRSSRSEDVVVRMVVRSEKRMCCGKEGRKFSEEESEDEILVPRS